MILASNRAIVRWLIGILLPSVQAMAQAGFFQQEAVAADHPLASRAGAEILAAGGNAIDAAVASSFALSVVRPGSCGIGGGGFMVVFMPDHPTLGRVEAAICYRERAPAAIDADYYVSLPDDASVRGGKSLAVPGTVAGLLRALEAFGTMPREVVLAPAIRLAEEGFTADAHDVSTARDLAKWFDAEPGRKDVYPFVWSRFLREGTLREGDRIALPEQARALRLIAEQGSDAFHTGEIARAILLAARRHGSAMSEADLAAPLVLITPPITTEFMGRKVLSMPPPSSGGIALSQVLGILEADIGASWQADEFDEPRPDLRRAAALRILGERGSAARIHRIAEATKHAFADRAAWLGDSLFVDVPWGEILSRASLRERAEAFDPERTLPPDRYGTHVPPPDDGGTSHLSVVDRWGNAVACTETINLAFGSLVAVEEFGFVLNNEMDDFTTRRGRPNAFGLVQSDRNLPAPRKAPLSSMSPTIVLDAHGRVEIVAGASGGPRIITGTLQAILAVLVDDAGALDAVASPRFHHQWRPDVLRVEDGIGAEARESLAARGHHIMPETSGSDVQLIRRSGKGWDAACDPRKGGSPAGE